MHRACFPALLALAVAMGACGARSDLATGAGGTGGTSSASSTGGSAGGSTVGPCVPGETKSCYDGPPGTSGVGVCRPGLSTCAADGSGFGPCAGQVLPGTDVCATPEDEDCDGTPASCLGLCSWSRSFGGPGLDWLQNAAASASGDMVITGTFLGPVDLGGVSIAGPESTSFFVASLGPGGATAWGKRLGGIESTGAFTSPIPAALTGNVVFAGHNFFALDFGAGPLASTYYLAELTAGGDHVFSGSIAPETPEGATLQVHDVVILADGRIRALITANSQLVFGDTVIPAGPGDAGVSVVLSFDAAGTPVTASTTGTDILTRGHLAVSEGGVAVAVGPIGSASTPTLTALAPDGAPLFTWSVLCDDPSGCNISGVGIDGAGNVIVGGEILGVTDLGGGPVGAPNEYSVFVTSLDPGGAHRWSRVFTEKNAMVPPGTARRGPLAVTGAGDIAMAGQFAGTTDFGMGPVTSNGETDGFVISLSSDGALRWVRTFGGKQAELIRGLALDAMGRVYIAGIFQGAFDVGCGPLVSNGDWDVFAAALLP